MARANVADDIPSEALHCFASLGAGGKCASNTERDLHRWAKSLFKCNLEPYFVPMELTAAHHLLAKRNLSFCDRVVLQVLGFCGNLCLCWTTQARGKRGTTQVQVPMLLPHELMHELARAGDVQAGLNNNLHLKVRSCRWVATNISYTHWPPCSLLALWLASNLAPTSLRFGTIAQH